jgi:deoxyribodipyrimidine photo-lyase
LSDHPALHAAAKTGAPVICLCVLDDAAGRAAGGAARWWLAQSLRALGADVAARGGSLVLCRGPAARAIPEVARESEAGAVYWNTIAQAPHQAVEKQLEAALAKLGVDSQSFPGDLLVPPSAVRNKEGRGLRVFTPFWRRVLSLGDPPKPLPAPKELRPSPKIASDRLEIWKLEPTTPDWASGLRETWTPGEVSARARLRDFLKHTARTYVGDRDRPDREGTSGLSAHLRFGELSPRQVWHAARSPPTQRSAKVERCFDTIMKPAIVIAPFKPWGTRYGRR